MGCSKLRLTHSERVFQRICCGDWLNKMSVQGLLRFAPAYCFEKRTDPALGSLANSELRGFGTYHKFAQRLLVCRAFTVDASGELSPVKERASNRSQIRRTLPSYRPYPPKERSLACVALSDANSEASLVEVARSRWSVSTRSTRRQRKGRTILATKQDQEGWEVSYKDL